MTCPISRLNHEPEIFENHDGLFIKHNGVIILVRCFGGWSWYFPIEGGKFKYGGETLGYHKLTCLESLRVYKALRKIKKATP